MPSNTLNNERRKNTPYMQNKKETRKRFTDTRPSLGVGDTIQKVTKATGIEKLAKFIAGEDCGCEERKEKLNSLFRYKQPLCMTEEEYNWWTEFKNTESTTLSADDATKVSQIWTRIFQAKKLYRPCSCNPREWQKMINELTIVYNTYE
jgi:hypothetical protein